MAELSKVPVQIVLRPYASSLPLASFAFGTGNALYGAFLLHWIPASQAHLLAMLLLAFAAPLELGPSIMAFLARDAGGATSFAIFGASWVVQGLELLFAPAGGTDPVGATFLICLVLCLLMLTLVTFKGKPLLGVVLVVAMVRTGCAAGAAISASATVVQCTGWAGLLLAVLAFYSGFAFLEEDVTQRLSPLTFRTGQAREALEKPLAEQIAGIEKEAGVRKQL